MANEAFEAGFDGGLGAAKKKKDKPLSNYPGFKRGGKVKKTGLAKVHKGEVVLTAHEAKTYPKKPSKKKHSRKKVSTKR